MKKLVLVNGAAGFLGTHVVREALAAGCEVRATDLAPQAPPPLAALGVPYVQADLLDMEQARKAAFGCTHVINVAGLFRFDATKEDLYKANVVATRNTCQAALEAGAERVVQVATIGVYGKLARNRAVDETHPKHPKNDYEKTKKQGEDAALRYWKRFGLPVVSLRPTVIYGPGSRYAVAWVVSLLALLRATGTKDIYQVTGMSLMCHVHVTDVARALVWLLDHGQPGEAYNCADSTPLSWGRLIEFLMEEFGLTAKRRIHFSKPLANAAGALLQSLPERLRRRTNERLARGWKMLEQRLGVREFLAPMLDPEFISYIRGDHLMSSEKLRKTGFEFKYPDTKAGLKETIAWYREQNWIPKADAQIERRPKAKKAG